MAKTPYFFKIILENSIQEGKFGIPKKFVRRYGNYLSEQVFLKVPSGAKWHVQLVKSGDDIWLGNGWRHFVDYYSLSHGSFLIFGFEDFKNCTFSVSIFDKTASEIDYPFDVHGHNEEQVHQPANQENDGVDVVPTRISENSTLLPFSRPCKKMKQENCGKQSEDDHDDQPMDHTNSVIGTTQQSEKFHQLITPKSIEVDVSPPQKREEKSMSRISRPWKKMKHEIGTGLLQVKRGNRDRVVKRTQRLSAEEIAKALDRANSYYKSNNHSFSIVLQPTHVHGDFRMVIPYSFAKKYFKEQRGSISLNSVDEKTWSVEYVYSKQRGYNAARIYRGWRKFVEDNHLVVGDVCVFEVINHNGNELKVVICRENQDAYANPPIGNKQHLNRTEIP